PIHSLSLHDALPIFKTLQAFYQSKGFNQVKVTPKFDTKGRDVIVTFVVEEGPQDTVETFRIAGNNSVPLKQLAPDGLRLAPNQPDRKSTRLNSSHLG